MENWHFCKRTFNTHRHFPKRFWNNDEPITRIVAWRFQNNDYRFLIYDVSVGFLTQLKEITST